MQFVAQILRMGGETFMFYIELAITTCITGILIGLFYGVSTSQLEIRNTFKPNQGIWRSAYNGGRVLLIIGSIVMLIYGIFLILHESLSFYPYTLLPQDMPYLVTPTLIGGGSTGLLIGGIFGLFNGGIACIKHVLLRIFLWRTKSIPWNYSRFLDYAAERILLRKVGGGYIFIHRLLLDYFASLEEEQDSRKGAVYEHKQDVLV
jgi:hypothetical protein